MTVFNLHKFLGTALKGSRRALFNDEEKEILMSLYKYETRIESNPDELFWMRKEVIQMMHNKCLNKNEQGLWNEYASHAVKYYSEKK